MSRHHQGIVTDTYAGSSVGHINGGHEDDVYSKTHLTDGEGLAESRGSATPTKAALKGVPKHADGMSQEATWFNEITVELADMILVLMDSLLEVSPRQIFEPAREQFAGCSVSVPAPTLASMHTALKIVRSISRNLATFLRPPLLNDVLHDDEDVFDIGDLLQSVGDMMSGMATTRGVELVIYHGDDSQHDQGQQAVKAVDFNPVYVRGNESALTYVLAHTVRQILATAKSGDSIELGLFVYSSQRPDFNDLDASTPVYGLPTRCIIDIAHKFNSRETRHAPNLETLLLQRLLTHSSAELTLDSLFRPQCALGRACELGFTLSSTAPPHSDVSPSLVHGVAEHPLLSHEPTFDQLSDFTHVLKDRKINVTVYTKELSTEPLLAALSSWGVDLAVVGNGESVNSYVPPERPAKGAKPFVFIDDDIDILKQQIQATNSTTTKRPAIHRVQSSNHVTPRQTSGGTQAVTIVYFASLNNFKLIKEVVRSALYPFSSTPEIIVVPKPVGPRRLLTILHTAVTKPTVDPSFSPNATSPSAAPPNMSNATLSPSGESSKPGTPRPSGPRSNSDRSVRSSVKENLPVSPALSNNEYFPSSKISDNNPLTGIRIQDSGGAVQGIYFNPKLKSNPSSPGGMPAIPLSDTFASMQELARAGGPAPEAERPLPSPLDQIHLSRRNTTPQGTTAPRLGPEHNVVPPIKVLVVDDNRINREICGKALRKIGVASDLAVNGKDALEKWRTGEFHMILMDIQMPVMGGLEATMQIRREEKMLALAGFPRGTPVADANYTPPVRTPSSESGSTPYPSSVVIVALTASRDEEDRVQALAAGCNDFLTKPVSTVWLHNKVTEWGSIKALQQWAPSQLPENITMAQVERANRVASSLVPPTERRTPSPGPSRRRNPVEVTSPPPSAPPTSAMNSASSSTGWSAQPSPMTFHGNLGVPTPVTADFSPLNRGPPTLLPGTGALNVIDELDVIYAVEQEPEHDEEEHYEDAREHPDPDGDGEGERENGNLVASSPVDRHNTAETPHH